MLKRNENIVVRKENEETYLFFNKSSERTHVLNDIGYIIYKCAYDEEDIDKIVDKVCNITTDDPKTAKDRINKFINSLIDMNILERI